MAKPSTTHVIEIETGIGEPAFIPLTLGQELQPISVGKKGMWRIESARVLDVHAFVYFDGSALFLQSADESASASVDGHPVGKAWTELHAPCKIDVGAARLRYRSLLAPPAPSPRTARSPLGAEEGQSGDAPLSFAKAARPFEPGAFANAPAEGAALPPAPVRTDDAPTRNEGSGGARHLNRTGGMPALIPLPDAPLEPVQNRTQQLARAPSAPAHVPSAPPPPMAPMIAPPPPIAPMGSMPPVPAIAPPMVPHGGPGYSGPYHYSGAPPHPSMPLGQSGSQQSMTDGMSDGSSGGSVLYYVAKYKELSLPKQILIILAPFCLLASAYLIAFDPSARQPGPPTGLDAGFDVTVVTMAPSPPGPTPIPTMPPPTVVIAPPPTAQPACPPGFVPYAIPVAPGAALPCVPVGTPPPGAPQPAIPAGTMIDAGSPKTLERQAVDAVAANDYRRAAAFYEQLQQQNPQNRVYAEAARILREKVDAGAP